MLELLANTASRFPNVQDVQMLGKANDAYFVFVVTLLPILAFWICRKWAFQCLKPEASKLRWLSRRDMWDHPERYFTPRGVFWFRASFGSIIVGFVLLAVGFLI